MSGLYNAIFGMNPATVLVAPMLTEELPERYFPRFRDCYVEDGNIVIYTRVGGGNRFESHGDPEWDFGESKLYEMPTFIETYDDDFDSTYGYYVFGVPDEWMADFERVTAGRLGELSDAYIERIAKCYEVDEGRLKESLAAAKMDAEALGNAPDWHGFFDALREEGGRRMSMCYLCDLCGAQHYDSGTWVDWESGEEEPIVVCKGESKRPRVTGKLAINYGRDDPKAICEHFEPKEGGDD